MGTGRKHPGAEGPMRDLLLDVIPALRAFAVALTGDLGRGDDLVQETLLRAWAGAGPWGGHRTAWLFAILRDRFLADIRRREAEAPPTPPEGSPFGRAFDGLPLAQREALFLVGAQGFTEAEAAEICGVAVPEIRIRVGRARVGLAAALDAP